jgi:putative two-component system response regulator
LHDIGKVAIPDSILLKPGKLDAEEFERIRRHCDHGSSICSPGADPAVSGLMCHTTAGARVMRKATTPVLAMAAIIALTHHERWDGGGYPYGLSGEQIPIEGRITAVADVFDALTSKRPYKPAFSVEKSLAIMREQRGTQFDPAVLDAFCDGLDEILAVYRELSDSPASDPPAPDGQ